MIVKFLVVLLLALLLIILWLLGNRHAGTRTPVSGTTPGTAPTGGPGVTGSPPSVPDSIAAGDLATLLQPRLAGTPADGSTYSGATPARVVWVDGGDEVLVHLDSTKIEIVGQSVLLSIDLEADQTGRTPLVVAFALGTDDTGGLIAATDQFPRGNGALAGRWGTAVQAAAWSALLSLASDHATERKLAPHGFAVVGGQLQLIAGPPLTVA